MATSYQQVAPAEGQQAMVSVPQRPTAQARLQLAITLRGIAACAVAASHTARPGLQAAARAAGDELTRLICHRTVAGAASSHVPLEATKPSPLLPPDRHSLPACRELPGPSVANPEKPLPVDRDAAPAAKVPQRLAT
jgi:hypothetical protein